MKYFRFIALAVLAFIAGCDTNKLKSSYTPCKMIKSEIKIKNIPRTKIIQALIDDKSGANLVYLNNRFIGKGKKAFFCALEKLRPGDTAFFASIQIPEFLSNPNPQKKENTSTDLIRNSYENKKFSQLATYNFMTDCIRSERFKKWYKDNPKVGVILMGYCQNYKVNRENKDKPFEFQKEDFLSSIKYLFMPAAKPFNPKEHPINNYSFYFNSKHLGDGSQGLDQVLIQIFLTQLWNSRILDNALRKVISSNKLDVETAYKITLSNSERFL